jgi:hypothetical protein
MRWDQNNSNGELVSNAWWCSVGGISVAYVIRHNLDGRFTAYLTRVSMPVGNFDNLEDAKECAMASFAAHRMGVTP